MAHLLSLIRVAVAEKNRASGEQASSADNEATIDGCHVSGARIVRRKRRVRLMVAVGDSRDGVVQTPGGTPMLQQQNGPTFGSWAANVAGLPAVSEGVVEAIAEETRVTDAACEVLMGDSKLAVHQGEDDSVVCGRTASKPTVMATERLPLEFNCGRSEHRTTRQLPRGQGEHELCDKTAASVPAAIPIVGDKCSINHLPRHTYPEERYVDVPQDPGERICMNGYQTSNESVLASDGKPDAQLTSTIVPSRDYAQLGLMGYSPKSRRRRKVSIGLSNRRDSDNGAFITSDNDSCKTAPTAATSKCMSVTPADTTRTGRWSSNTTHSQPVICTVRRNHIASNATRMVEVSADEKSTELGDADRKHETERQPTSSYAGLLTRQDLDTFIAERILSGRHLGDMACKTRGRNTVGVDIHRYANSFNYFEHTINEPRPNAADDDFPGGMFELLNVFKPSDEENVTSKCKENSITGEIVAGGKPRQQFNATVSDTRRRYGWRRRQATSFDRGASVQYRCRMNYRTPFAYSARRPTSLLQNSTVVPTTCRSDTTTESAYVCNENREKTTFASYAADNCAAYTQHGVRTTADRPDQFEVFGAGLHHGYVQAKNIFQVGNIGLEDLIVVNVNFIDGTWLHSSGFKSDAVSYCHVIFTTSNREYESTE